MNKIKSSETILDKWYKPRMHWKTFNRGQVIRAMEEYHNQFKQPDISEDVETDLEKDLPDEEFNNIANASYSLFPILTKKYKADMVSFQHGFEIGYKYKNRELAHKPTVDEDELIEAIKLIKEAIPNSNGEWGKRATDFISKHQTNNL